LTESSSRAIRRGEEERRARRRDGRMDVILARGSSSIDR